MAHRGLILSLFPGADLFSRPFEERGFCVVRGPELLLGQDIKNFHAVPGKFDGVIGGPPCQKWSTAGIYGGSTAPDLIPEFMRVCCEAEPRWIVMENVIGAEKCADVPPFWTTRRLRDWDCGGLTMRKRTFFTWPFSLACEIHDPPKRPGNPEYSVLASNWKVRTGSLASSTKGVHRTMTISQAGRLQGFRDLASTFSGEASPLTKRIAITLLGNGVPRAMGAWIADAVVRWLEA